MDELEEVIPTTRKGKAEQIRDEYIAGANTAERVGGLLCEMVDAEEANASAIALEVANRTSALNEEISARVNSVGAEESARKTADTTEKNARIAKDNELSASITELSQSLGHDIESAQEEIETLKSGKIDKSDIVNSLTTADQTKPLSAYCGASLFNLAMGKVDKVSGKGLSTNDYTNDEKAKVAKIGSIESGMGNAFNLHDADAENIVDAVNHVYDGKVDKVSGKGLSKNDYTDAEKAKVAQIESKVDKVSGKGLSTNDYTDAEKAKLSELEGQSLSVKEVKTNGNIVLKDGSGNEKEYMSATPSGDPMHYAYEKYGAVWNANTGYWELNGLLDMTNKDMKIWYARGIIAYSPDSIKAAFSSDGQLRTATIMTGEQKNGNLIGNCLRLLSDSANIETAKITKYNFDNLNFYTTGFQYLLSNSKKFRSLYGTITSSGNASFTGAFFNCESLRDIKLKGIKTNVSFSYSPNISNESISYIISNASTEAITITLHATAYARAMADASVQSALATKTNVTLVSA